MPRVLRPPSRSRDGARRAAPSIARLKENEVRPARRISGDRGSGRRRPFDHAGRRMAAGQLSSRRRADPRDSRGSAAWILPPIAEARGRSVRRLPACIRDWRGHASPTATADSILDSLRLFVRAYQRVQPLTIGELWAVAITLRIVLVENLRRAAARIVSSRAARQDADAVADRLLGVNGYAVEPDALVRRDSTRRLCRPPSSSSWCCGCAIRIPTRPRRGGWLDERLTSQGTTADEIVHEEHQRQGTSNVTVRNIITSMRLLSDVDWPEFFESVSLVDEIAALEERLRRQWISRAATCTVGR